MRLFATICIWALFANSCAPSAFPPPPAINAEALFIRILEEGEAESAEALESLKRNFPHSPWTDRAQVVETLRRTNAAKKKQISRLEIDQARCLRKGARLEKEKGELEGNLEQLKKLIIEMEMRAR